MLYHDIYRIYPQMSTPEDPVIHSPPSLRGPIPGSPNTTIAAALAHNSPNGYGSPSGADLDSRNSCESPGSAGDMSSEDARRRQKTCRVCGDHATGYNFNVITCESCKAFFRRNALRPKEFKCPYNEDCDINSVSRRFCQKCRLRKCFSVGMKKEWILNEEQLRRRKNSRLNNMTGGRMKHEVISHTGNAKIMTSPLHSPPVRAGGPMTMGSPIGSGPSSAFPLLSPADSASSDASPPTSALLQSRSAMMADNSLDQSSLLQQRLTRMGAAMQQPQPQQPLQQHPAPMARPGNVTLSMEQYTALMQMAQGNQAAAAGALATTTTQPITPIPSSTPMCMSGATSTPQQVDSSPDYKPNIFSPSMGTPNGMSPFDLGSLSGMNGADLINDRMNSYVEQTITSELGNGSPELFSRRFSSNGDSMETMQEEISPGEHLGYKLNTAELRALDEVKDAFSGMNESLEAGKQYDAFMKSNKSPADIMNIMDVTMRRLVKMAKKLTAFNEVSNEGRFALLKASMVEMLTLRGVARFDASSMSWKSPVVPSQFNVSLSMFDQLNVSSVNSQKIGFLQFVHCINDELRRNELAINLIMLIVLFSPRANISHDGDKRVMSKHCEQYKTLFYRYLESVYGDDGRNFQMVLPKALKLLSAIADSAITLFLGTVKPEDAEPLPREFFKTN